MNALRSSRNFPITDDTKEVCKFLCTAWEKGWFDEYSDEHFLIRVIENRLSDFIGIHQLTENEINMFRTINDDGSINFEYFNSNFCMNFSKRMHGLTLMFGEDNIKRFILDQMSAGKQHYDEDIFFQSLSEISILSFYGSIYSWQQAIYEPKLHIESAKNPEATLKGIISYSSKGTIVEELLTINIEVKSPKFTQRLHQNNKIAIPTVLLTNEGREKVKLLCEKFGVTFLAPRVMKLKDFINSAADKFTHPQNNEFNLLYINWSYSEFPSNSFLEAWSLLTNKMNGILTHPKVAENIGIKPDALKKISAIIVYTESLEGIMFGDFHHVWQTSSVGLRFKLWVNDDNLRKLSFENKTDVIRTITGMNPCKDLLQYAMVDYKTAVSNDIDGMNQFAEALKNLIANNMLIQ